MGSDVLILTIYFLVVIYVLYQMALSVESSLENKLKVSLNTETLTEQVNRQLAQRPADTQKIGAKIDQVEYEGRKFPPFLALQVTSHSDPEEGGIVIVEIGPSGKMPLAMTINDLSVSVRNMTGDAQVFIDWDKSSVIAGMSRRTQRVVRSGIPITGGLPNSQILTVINPRESFLGRITGENCLGLDPETQTLQAKRPLAEMLDIAEYITDMLELSQRKNQGDDGVDLMEMIGPSFAYGVRLMLGIRQITYEQNSHTTYLMLPFEFEAILLADEIAFPPLRWLLKRPRPATARDALSSLLLGRPRL